MAKHQKVFVEKIITHLPVIAAIVFIVLFAGIFLYFYFFSNDVNNYLIQNKYYSFKLQTPKNWFAEEDASYSENIIAQIMAECKTDGSGQLSSYKVGEFRFKDQRYPADFGQAQKFPVGSRSGAILDITVNCVPDGAKNKLANYSYGNLKIGGEKAFEEFLGLIGFGQTKYMAFLHNNLQYTASEYVYVSPADKASEQKIRDNYTAVFNKIVSSFSFNGN